jgi:hypothetical protein
LRSIGRSPSMASSSNTLRRYLVTKSQIDMHGENAVPARAQLLLIGHRPRILYGCPASRACASNCALDPQSRLSCVGTRAWGEGSGSMALAEQRAR